MASGLEQPISEFHQILSADAIAPTKPINILPGLTVQSSKSISKHHGILLRNLKVVTYLTISKRSHLILLRFSTRDNHPLRKVHAMLSLLSERCGPPYESRRTICQNILMRWKST